MTAPTAAGPLRDELQPLRLRCFEYQGQVGTGWTESHRAVARDPDGRAVPIILKLREPGPPEGRGHFRGTSLALELICAVLGRALGLQVPDYAIADVSPIFAGGVTNHVIHTLLQANIGPNFGSVRIIPQPLTWDPNCRVRSFELRQALDDIMCFDASVFNGDRQRPNPNLLWDGAAAVHVIDHGLACPAYHWTAQERATSPVLPDSVLQEHAGYLFLRQQGCTFDQIPNRWPSVATSGFWSSLRAIVPPEWERRSGDLDAIFDFLSARAVRMADVTDVLRRVLR